MKKMIAMLLACMMLIACTACAAKTETAAPAQDASSEPAAAETAAAETPAAEETEAASEEAAQTAADSDVAYVQANGKLVVGITDFAPMDYQDENGEWIGFDADMAKAFAKSLGVEAEFVEIDWDNKIMELGAKTIDCVWNGMTLTDEVTSAMACSNAYCNNSQVVVVPADKAADYQSVDACSSLNFAVESGSAGKAEVEKLGYSFTDLLEDDCYRALFAVVARDRQRHALGFVIDAENDELTGFRLFGNERSFDLHVRHRGIEFLFARNFVHFFHPFNMNHTFPRKVPYSRIITRTLLSCKPYSLYFYGFAITIFSFRTIRHENSFASSSARTASL